MTKSSKGWPTAANDPHPGKRIEPDWNQLLHSRVDPLHRNHGIGVRDSRWLDVKALLWGVGIGLLGVLLIVLFV